jgi:hypothetical protein
MRNKPFDGVEWQDTAAEQIYEQIAGMTLEEQLSFWHQRNQELRQRQRRLQGTSLAANSTREDPQAEL